MECRIFSRIFSGVLTIDLQPSPSFLVQARCLFPSQSSITHIGSYRDLTRDLFSTSAFTSSPRRQCSADRHRHRARGRTAHQRFECRSSQPSRHWIAARTQRQTCAAGRRPIRRHQETASPATTPRMDSPAQRATSRPWHIQFSQTTRGLVAKNQQPLSEATRPA